MVGAKGRLDGPPFRLPKVRPTPPVDHRRLADGLLFDLHRSGLKPSDIHQVIALLPLTRRTTYRRCGELALALGDAEAEA